MFVQSVFTLAVGVAGAMAAPVDMQEAASIVPAASTASNSISCAATRSGVLGIWEKGSPLLNSVTHNVSLTGIPDSQGCIPLVTMNGTKPARSERYVFWQCNSTAIPQPKNLYNQLGQIRLERDSTICLTSADGLKPAQNGRLVGSKCVTQDNLTALAPQSFEYDFYDNLAFFNGGAQETERTSYMYSQNPSTANKAVALAYTPYASTNNTQAHTALRISIQSTTPQKKKKSQVLDEEQQQA